MSKSHTSLKKLSYFVELQAFTLNLTQVRVLDNLLNELNLDTCMHMPCELGTQLLQLALASLEVTQNSLELTPQEITTHQMLNYDASMLPTNYAERKQ